jgi:hypothetical protein
MGTTPTYQLPYPEAVDPADVPVDMRELADRTELVLQPLAYVEFTANVAVSATTEATPTDIVTAGSVSFDGKPVWLEFYSPHCSPPSVVGHIMVLRWYQDGASLGTLAQIVCQEAVQGWAPVFARRRLTPAAGAHTFKVGGAVNALTGFVGAGAGGAAGSVPGYIRITRA